MQYSIKLTEDFFQIFSYMDTNHDVQRYFFEAIKHRLAKNISLVDEIANLLNVSNDSAYRRIRGEKLLDIQEVAALCQRYNISFDGFLGLNANAVNFEYKAVDDDFHFFQYLEYIHSRLALINQFETKDLYFAAKDIPFFHHFQFPGLAYFKSYFWMRSILEYEEYEHKVFAIEEVPDEIAEWAPKIWQTYKKTPCTEIWSNESINITLRQIEYCWECGLFKDQEEAILLCEEMQTMLSHIQKEARIGNKFQYNSDALKEGADFKLYYNEVTISDNTIFFKMDDQELTFITHNLFNILTTSNQHFCQQTFAYLQKILQKSTLISGVSEKDRSIFFRNMQNKVGALKEKIS